MPIYIRSEQPLLSGPPCRIKPIVGVVRNFAVFLDQTGIFFFQRLYQDFAKRDTGGEGAEISPANFLILHGAAPLFHQTDDVPGRGKRGEMTVWGANTVLRRNGAEASGVAYPACENDVMPE